MTDCLTVCDRKMLLSHNRGEKVQSPCEGGELKQSSFSQESVDLDRQQ